MKYKTTSGKTLIIEDKNEINRGGEGRIILIENHPNIVAKIFHKSTQNQLEKKTPYLHKLDSNIFVVPQELLYKNSQLLGYTMQYLDSNFFPISAIFSSNFCQKNNFEMKMKIKIAQKLKKAVENAHSYNIIIGDFNQFNVLINSQAEIKIIDTDSFQTPNQNHSGVLLDDIRDYYYNGIVDKNSDYFALSILIFYMLSFTHPFKGVHSKIKGLKDRMIHKLPVFAINPELKIPKCYVPISDKPLMSNFERMYLNGERFLLSLEKDISQKIAQTQIITQKATEKDIIITPVLNNSKIQNIYFNDELGYIKTDTNFVVFSAKNRGYLNKNHTIKRTEYDDIYIGEKNILVRKKNILFHYKNDEEIIEIKNFKFKKNAKISIKKNILIVIENDKMFWLFIDEIYKNSIKNQRYEVFSKGFSYHSELIQNSGGIKRIFYNSGMNISNIKVDKNIKHLFQHSNTGIMQYIDNKLIKTKYFSIINNEINFSDFTIEDNIHFGFSQTTKTEGLIFEPADNEINIRRNSDFKIISKIKCSFINPQTALYYSKAGLISFENQTALLINSR